MRPPYRQKGFRAVADRLADSYEDARREGDASSTGIVEHAQPQSRIFVGRAEVHLTGSFITDCP